ncbi:MAG TPA: S1C family serine protease [Methylomirabilota bacterium]|nr:S1C family serine protease [Methylomirabilota bacterium]
MKRRIVTVLLALALLPSASPARTISTEPRPDPREAPAAPSYVQRVEPALVGLHVRADPDRPSSARLGAQRYGTAIVFDPRGYAVTVSYVVLDAVRIEARLRDGRLAGARVAGLDLDTGLAVVRLEGEGPWPVADLVSSADVRVGAVTGTVGIDEDDDLVQVTSTVKGIRRFSAFWEYMLDRALLLAPSISSWGGSAAVDDRGRVIGIVSLRVGDDPYVSVAIPAEKLLAVKDELITAGRVISRRPRPWLGLYTAAEEGRVVVDGFNDAGPARQAGFRRGDAIVGVNGVAVRSQEEFYEALWARQAGDTIAVAVQRGARVQTISVRSIDRHQLYQRTP